MNPTSYTAKEYKVICLRETPLPADMMICDGPAQALAYWQQCIATSPDFNPEQESFYVLLLNTRRRVKCHVAVSRGTHDTLLVHPTDVFRPAVVAAAHAVVLMHNHPSGESAPSEADIKVTRDLIRAGQLIKIDVMDHVIVGNGQHTSLRELGYFHV